MKKILILLLIASCSKGLTSIQKEEKKKLRKEKCVVLTAMVIHGIGFKIVADKQKVIK